MTGKKITDKFRKRLINLSKLITLTKKEKQTIHEIYGNMTKRDL